MIEEEIKKTLDLFNNVIYEVRTVTPPILNGYFKDRAKLLEEVKKNPNLTYYFIINEVKEEVYLKAENKEVIRPAKKNTATSDTDIVKRKWLFIDFDPIRKSKTSSTNEQKQEAFNKLKDVWKYLKLKGFKTPILADSGNGYHLIFKINMENTEENTQLLKNFLDTLSENFSDDKTDIDKSVFNASRITKLYGCLTTKGENTELTPHRPSKILKASETLEENEIELFKKVIEENIEEKKGSKTMNDHVKEEVKKHFKEYAEETGRPTGKTLFNCFLPNHDDTNGSMQFKGSYYKCYGCGQTLDIFNLYAIDHNLDVTKDFNYIKNELAKKYGIKNNYKALNTKETTKPKKESKINYTNYYNKCNKDVAETDYFEKRGITKDLIEKYNLGYNKETNYAVLPVSKTFYMERDTKELTDEERTKQKRLKHVIPKGASVEMFNKHLIEEANFRSVIFITESILDAISLEVVNPTIKAVALNGKEHYLEIVDLAEKVDYKGYFIIALDNDENGSGQETSRKLKEELDKRSIRNIVLNRENQENYRGNKDINEFLLNNEEALKQDIRNIDRQCEEILKREATKLLEEENALKLLKSFNEATLDREQRDATETGIARLDKALFGGFYKKNLIILGASSGAGKTTLALQIADNIARDGQDVLIFSLEMSKEELIAKSISRLMYLEDKKLNGVYSTGKGCLSTRQILAGAMYEGKASKETQELYSRAYEDYRDNLAEHIFINECNENLEITIDEIEARIKRQLDVTERKPFVVIDYLQIIENKEKGLTDIQATGKIVKDLKRLARKYKITILVISAFNRTSNYTDVSYNSFRDSSTIEYTADVLIGLQLSVLDTSNDVEETRDGAYKIEKKIKKQVAEAKQQEVKDVTLKIIKNRNGVDKTLSFIKFYGKNNYFDFLKFNGAKIIED